MRYDPLVSIVLPTRNRATMLEGCIRSCLDQTYRNIELIIIDDGCADETPQILLKYSNEDPRVRVFREEIHLLPALLNYGFRWTKGDLLTWMCDDDLYEPDAIEIMVRELQKRPDVGLVYCDFKNIDTNGNIINVEKRGEPPEMDNKSVVGRCVLYRRSVYAKLGEYSVADYLNEDDEYWLRVRDHFKIFHIDAAPLLYRLHDSSLTEEYRGEAVLAQHRTWAKRAKTKRESRHIMGTGYIMAANLALYRKGKIEALHFFWKGLANNPLRIAWAKLFVKLFLPKSMILSLWSKK